MNTQEFQTYQNYQKLEIQALQRIADALERVTLVSETTNQALIAIASALEQIIGSAGQKAPNYQQSLENWTLFDWASIGATVERTDAHGVAVVSWRGLQFIRRSPLNKFSESVWFSRCIGKDSSGENQYERLITFKRLPQAEPVPERVSRLVR